jgi:hypothetical protein
MSQRRLRATIHNCYKSQTPIPRTGFEPPLPQFSALDHTAVGIGYNRHLLLLKPKKGNVFEKKKIKDKDRIDRQSRRTKKKVKHNPRYKQWAQ